MPKKKKPAVGFYDLTGCNGCLLSFLFNEDEVLDIAQHVDIKTFRLIKDVKDEKKFDIVFMEGLVASNNDLEVLKSVRSKTDVLVALGACACTGCVPAYRNFIDTSKYSALVYDRIKELRDLPATPISEHVAVDYYIPGCPPDKKQILTFIKDILLGKNPYDYDKPVCFECRLNENRCLLDDGKMCLGPMTRGGCNSICTNGGLECWGCRGPTPDANTQLMAKLLEEKGFAKDHIRQRMRTFAGLMIEKPPKQKVVKPKPVRKKEKAKKKKVKKKPKPKKKKAKAKKVKKKPKKKLKKKAKKKVKKKPKKKKKKVAKKKTKSKKSIKKRASPKKKLKKGKAAKKKGAKAKKVKVKKKKAGSKKKVKKQKKAKKSKSLFKLRFKKK
ncbi:hypothetical protein KY349_04290 [Candidatus Woesearchaeota archaeon]|jgi:coenzyme F420-reducing hydrogenase gamma subunit|nr:hypothetical protein [Candidatus Woesearchaeota archaeon]